ncbi:putative multidrug resistance protein [Panicum miliaceum]|uniref:Multidrug resistance protein n=1 Tax=Panicum miliaceum TaxID=4540 RepID=A0A3L6QG73_PANMI|nr:putative multidrug resistance protein [Panicum miliaceum]
MDGGEAAETAAAAPALGPSSFMSVFKHADGVDVALMVLGLVGAMGDGMSTPAMLLISSRVTNDFGRGPDQVQHFSARINRNARNIVFLACASWVMAFLGEQPTNPLTTLYFDVLLAATLPRRLTCTFVSPDAEGYCWARTAERQASRMRARYLRAVLRQDVGYFDLRSGPTSEVVTSVSNDSLVVQDALAEKVPSFVMNATMFAGSYAVGLAVGERGVQLSGGQKQRIAIAGAILKSPKILLLDEATSALDTKSEHAVQAALDLASVGRTTIVVAHRLSTVRNADMIAVMQSGEVQEQGSHDDLIANENGLYSTLIRLQKTKDSGEVNETSGIGTVSAAVGQSNRHSMSRRFSWPLRSSSARSVGDAKHDGNIEKPNLSAPSFRRLLMLNAPEWKQALVGSFSAVLFGSIQPIYAYVMGSMFSVYFLTDHSEIIGRTRVYALVFAALAVISFLLNMLQHYNFGAMGEYLTKRISEQMLMKILTFEIEWFDSDENSTGAICSWLAKDANVAWSLVALGACHDSSAAINYCLLLCPSCLTKEHVQEITTGTDIKMYNLHALRRHIGLVSQEPTLFAGTIRENIMYGTDIASETEIEDAARSANAHDFICNLKDGYDTWCGERGFQLSGGQKQRIAIARAILKNPTILLLDEATSALDSQSEKVVQEALERVMMGRTSVVVAHRLTTIQKCDLIVVLEKGIVVEKGTHSSLMAKSPSGKYFGLVSLQQGGSLH